VERNGRDMMKYFLLIAGDAYYPRGGTSDWKKTFSTLEEAENSVSKVEHKITISKGYRKGQEVVEYTTYMIDGREYDWYEVVDLKEYIF